MPASTTIISSPKRISVQFIPNSPMPPRGIISRTLDIRTKSGDHDQSGSIADQRVKTRDPSRLSPNLTNNFEENRHQVLCYTFAHGTPGINQEDRRTSS